MMTLTNNTLVRFATSAGFILALATLIVAAPTSASAITISTFDHSGDGLASGNGADTYVLELAPTSIQGATDNAKFRYNPNNQMEVMYVRFDLSGIGSGTIDSAKFQLYDYRYDEGQLLKNKTLGVWGMTNESLDNWGEGTTNWNNVPGITTQAPALDGPDFNSDTVFLGSVTSTIDGPWTQELDVTNLTDFLKNDTNDLVTLMVQNTSAIGSLFYLGSKETDQLSRTDATVIPLGSAAPRLILTVVPEPSSIMSLFLSGWVMMVMRRRTGRCKK